jgi:hypothetical protein
MRILYHCIKLMFFMAQAVSWYIIATYCFVILPYADPTENKNMNMALIAINYIVHFVFISLHHYSHWMVFLTDPGYYETFYRTETSEEPMNEADIKALEAARDAMPDNQLA